MGTQPRWVHTPSSTIHSGFLRRFSSDSGSFSSDTGTDVADPLERLGASLRQVLQALAYVHERGLVHRDLKPSNIMVDDERRVRLMDFGLVRSADEGRNTLSRRVVGTYRYMAPEQARGLPVDARADLYSLGVILYELLCGRPPFLAQPPGERIYRRDDD